MEQKQLTIRDMSIKYNVNEKTVRRWIHRDGLKATKDIKGRYVVDEQVLEQFIRDKTQQA